MKIRLWQACAIGGIFLTLALVVAHFVAPGRLGYLGFADRASGDGSLIVTRVDADSPAARAGIVVGDRLVRLGDALSRVANEVTPPPGTHITFEVTHAGVTRKVTLVSVGVRSPRLFVATVAFYELLRLVMLGVALVIVLRRPDRADARALATFFIAFAFGFFREQINIGAAAASILLVAQLFAVLFALQQVLLFATLFPQPSARGLRAMLRIAAPYLLAPLLLAVLLLRISNAPIAQLVAGWIATLAFLGSMVAIVVAFALSWSTAPAADRPRLQWIAMCVVVGFAGLILTVVLEQVVGLVSVWAMAPAAAIVAIPIGVTYAIFRHRMFDVSFVVSRTLTFAVLSAVVVLAFSALEWLISTALVRVGHVQNVMMEAALALVLGFSMDRMRGRVDRAVDQIFFRERHRNEDALRRFTEESAYITRPEVLTERTLDALERHARVGAALYLLNDGGYALRGATMVAEEVIDVNDRAVVAMRARRGPVDINDPEAPSSALPGIIAFPMLLRGNLSGFICCSARSTGEDLDPDERKNLAGLALAVANAFATIEIDELRALVVGLPA